MNITKHLSVYKGLPKNIYILFISIVINKFGGFITPLMTLILTVKIGFTESQVGLYTTIAMFSQLPFIVIGGILVDRFGGKKVIVSLHLIGSLFYITCGMMKPDLTVLILIIMASNIYAMASPAFNALVPLVTPTSLTKNAYSLVYLGLNLGLAVGPLIGGVLFNNHLNLLFFIDAFTTISSAGLILFFFSNDNGDRQLETDKIIKQENNKADTIFSFLLKNPSLIIFSFILLVYNFCYIQWNFMLPLQTVALLKEIGPKIFGFLITVNAITVVIFTPLLTSLTQKMPPLKSVFIGGIFYLTSFMMFALSKFTLMFILAIIILTIGEILVTINSNNYIAKSTPSKYMGKVSSLLFIVNGMGYAIGPVIMGYVIIFTGFRNAWFIVSAIMLCSVISMYFASHIEKKSRRISS